MKLKDKRSVTTENPVVFELGDSAGESHRLERTPYGALDIRLYSQGQLIGHQRNFEPDSAAVEDVFEFILSVLRAIEGDIEEDMVRSCLVANEWQASELDLRLWLDVVGQGNEEVLSLLTLETSEGPRTSSVIVPFGDFHAQVSHLERRNNEQVGFHQDPAPRWNMNGHHVVVMAHANVAEGRESQGFTALCAGCPGDAAAEVPFWQGTEGRDSAASLHTALENAAAHVWPQRHTAEDVEGAVLIAALMSDPVAGMDAGLKLLGDIEAQTS